MRGQPRLNARVHGPLSTVYRNSPDVRLAPDVTNFPVPRRTPMLRLRLPAYLLLAGPILLSACDSVTNNDPDPVRRAFVTRVTIDTFPFLNPIENEGWDSDSPTNTSDADLY